MAIGPDDIALHQVHPLKLSADVRASLISNVLLWRHSLPAGVAVRLLLPIAGSAVVLRFGNVERLRTTPQGQYVLHHMPPSSTAIRLSGDLLMAAGSWVRQPLLIGLGLAVVGAGWSHGLVRSTTTQKLS